MVVFIQIIPLGQIVAKIHAPIVEKLVIGVRKILKLPRIHKGVIHVLPIIGVDNLTEVKALPRHIGNTNVVKYIAENILFYCKDTNYEHVYRCMLGITVGVESLYTEYDEEKGVIYRKERVKVSGVSSASSAAYGILYSGDIINSVTIDGVTYEVSRTFHVVDAMLNARVKSKVTLNVTRGSETLDLDVTFTSDDVFNADS